MRRNSLEELMLNMDAISKLEKILKLILKGDCPELSKNEELKSLLKAVSISENINADGNTRTYVEKVLISTELVLKLFLNNFETFFNAFIEYIFHQIQNIFHYVIFSKTVYDFPVINLYNIINLIVEITIKHPCDENFKVLENFYRWNINEIKLKQDAEYCSPLLIEELTMHLRIISTVYEVICNLNEVQHDNCDVKQLVKCMITGNCEFELFARLVCGSSKVLMIQTLIDVIPKFIEFTRCYSILEVIWEKICNMYMMSSEFETSKMFIIFCYLSEFYFAVDNKKMMTNVFTSSSYWIFIQNGLINSDFEVRKQALFLTKTSLNYVAQNTVNFSCYKNEIENFQAGERALCKLPLIHWEEGMKFDELNKLCIIIEYLEEKQVHIVKPIFSVIENFLCIVQEQKLDVSWFLIVIERMLSHDNMQIIRQGITNLMKVSIWCYHEKYAMTKAIKLLVRSLNNTQVLMCDLPLLLEELHIFFEKCTKHESGKTFFKILLCEMCDIQWSSEALYAITYSLQFIKSNKYWSVEEMNLMKKLLISGTANHYTYIKSGMQCQLLLTSINLIDTCNVSIEDVHNFLNSYQEKILQRKTLLWESVAKWIGNCFGVEDAQRFIHSSVGQRNFGRMMVLLCDSYADDLNFLQEVKNLLKNVSVLFVGVHARPYCDTQIQDSYLSLICDVMRESCGDCDFCNIFRPFLSDFLLYVKMQLGSALQIGDFQSCKALMECLSTILKHGGRQLSDMMSTWSEEIIKNLVSKSDSKVMLPVQEYVQITLVNLMMDNDPRETGMIETYLRTQLNTPLVKTSEDLTVTKDLQMFWGRMNSEFLRGKWQVLSKLNASPLEILHVTKFGFISCCVEALDLSGYTVLFPLMSTIGKALPQLLGEPGLRELIDAIWRLVMERKKNDEYANLIQRFVEIVFQLEVIQNGGDDIRKTLVYYSQMMLAENATTHTANILVKQIQKIGFHEGGIYLFKELLPRSLIFGQPMRKDERLIRDLCSIIEKSGLSPLTNYFSCSNEVRARSVQFILTLNPADEIHSRFCEDLFEPLIALEKSNCKNKTRYFSDSHVHRVKQRLLQALLLLEPFMMKDESDKLWDWLSKKILFENNQTSVRYLQEWLMLRMINRNHRYRNAVWSYFDEGLEKRPGSLCSFISIIYHFVKCVSREEMADLIEKAVNTFLPYCMAQHFSVRLYAQVTLEKLLETAENLCLKRITEQCALVRKSLYQSIERGNAMRNSSKLREDFYFTVFDPVEHYSLRTIFFELPRLANVNPEDLIPDSMFGKIGVSAEKSFILLTNKSDVLEKFSPGKWVPERSNEGHFREDSDDTEESKMTNNFQKKIIPVKYVTPNGEELFRSASYGTRNVLKDGFVVVASLIDRMPNLGGLSRTCEIFGACELVIGSLKYAEDKQFQSLSVTAEKWITITEVKPFYLRDYLIKMKRNGYTVMAAEQTVNSKSLQSVKFPKKCLLLLGNEKEGIPPTLLPLMDICIEIPQVGVIRSLNVHVTGALFLWEYAKQHHLT